MHTIWHKYSRRQGSCEAYGRTAPYCHHEIMGGLADVILHQFKPKLRKNHSDDRGFIFLMTDLNSRKARSIWLLSSTGSAAPRINQRDCAVAYRRDIKATRSGLFHPILL
jgi:hypothetical protein